MDDLLIEVVPTVSGDLGGPRLPEIVEFDQYADVVSRSIVAVAQKLRGTLDNVQPTTEGWSPKEVQVHFGITLEASGNVLIVKGSAGATFSATITWRRD